MKMFNKIGALRQNKENALLPSLLLDHSDTHFHQQHPQHQKTFFQLLTWTLFCKNITANILMKFPFTDLSLRENCPNTELFLVRIFLYSDTVYLI